MSRCRTDGKTCGKCSRPLLANQHGTNSFPPTMTIMVSSLLAPAPSLPYIPAQSKTQARTRPRYWGTIRKSDIAVAVAAAAVALAGAVSEKEFWFSPSPSSLSSASPLFAFASSKEAFFSFPSVLTGQGL